jgi:hypothetical protein
MGAYLKDADAWPRVNLEKVDFSKVNEVGEGVVIQYIFGKRGFKQDKVNLRIAVSAPSGYQSKEIFEAIKPSFVGYTLAESDSTEFLRQVNLREFSEKEAMSWSR